MNSYNYQWNRFSKIDKASVYYSTLSSYHLYYNFTLALEYGLVKTQMRKNTVGPYFSSKDSITDRLKTFTSLNQVNIFIINYQHNIQPFTIY